jgi:hypothetical protein
VREELAEHLTLLTDEYARARLPLDEARRRAKLKLPSSFSSKPSYFCDLFPGPQSIHVGSTMRREWLSICDQNSPRKSLLCHRPNSAVDSQ